MPVKDYAKKEDLDYYFSKYRDRLNFDFDQAVKDTPKLLSEVNALLKEFSEKILYDENSINEFGFGLDDIVTLPIIRSLTCCKGVVFPPKMDAWMKKAFKNTHCKLY